MTKPRFLRSAAIGVTCAAVAAGAGVIGSASAASSTSASSHAYPRSALLARIAVLRRAVHADVVLPGRNGTFRTISYDRGIIESVSGSQLTIREGSKTAEYRVVTLTIPANATVRYQRAPSSLAQLAHGERVFVLSGPKHTRVGAFPAPPAA